ncbi:MAG: gamma-glutamylcyclotransferase family protein [Sphingobium sp.]
MAGPEEDRGAPLPVFVYGTLRPGDVGFAEAGLAGRVDLLGPARVNGTLYDLGDYPGIVPGGSGVVMGELLLPRDGGVLPLLDEYEIYDPADPKGSEYQRLRVLTLDLSLSVWIYSYNRSVTGLPVISGGDWRRFR